MKRAQVRGTISSAGFEHGHRFVIGCWHQGPFGPFADVMWAQPDGCRVLLASSERAATFITSIYEFDEVRAGGVDVRSDGRTTTAVGHGLDIRLVGGRLRPIPFPRPRFVTRVIEAPIARKLMSVETYGVSPHGVHEWYQSRGWRWVEDGSASLEGVDLRPPQPFGRPAGFGFSEPPQRPSIVDVAVTMEWPDSAGLAGSTSG